MYCNNALFKHMFFIVKKMHITDIQKNHEPNVSLNSLIIPDSLIIIDRTHFDKILTVKFSKTVKYTGFVVFLYIVIIYISQKRMDEFAQNRENGQYK